MRSKFVLTLVVIAALCIGVIYSQKASPTSCGRVVISTEEIQRTAEQMIGEGCVDLRFYEVERGYWFASGRTFRTASIEGEE